MQFGKEGSMSKFKAVWRGGDQIVGSQVMAMVREMSAFKERMPALNWGNGKMPC